MVYQGVYQADLGYDFFGVSLITRFRTADGVELLPNEGAFLPPSFSNWVDPGSGVCQLPVVPRRAVLYLSDILQFELPIPFRGGTPEYVQFLNEIGLIPDVRAFDILPEQVNPAQCLLLLMR